MIFGRYNFGVMYIYPTKQNVLPVWYNAVTTLLQRCYNYTLLYMSSSISHYYTLLQPIVVVSKVFYITVNHTCTQ